MDLCFSSTTTLASNGNPAESSKYGSSYRWASRWVSPHFGQTLPPSDSSVKADVFQPLVPSQPPNSNPPDVPYSEPTMDSLIDAIDTNMPRGIDKIFNHPSGRVQGNVAQFTDNHPEHPLRLTIMKGPNGKNLFWFDLSGADWHPLFDKLSQKFSFLPIKREAPDHNHIPYEVPAIDKDSIQLTAYCSQLTLDAKEIDVEPLRIFLGHHFLVTTHKHPRPSVESTLELITKSGKFFESKELLTILLGDIIERCRNITNSLSKDFKIIETKLRKKKTDDSVLEHAGDCRKKISQIFDNMVRQKQVLDKLLYLNQFFDSKLVSPKDLTRLTHAIDKNIEILEHFRTDNATLLNDYRTRVTNDTDDSNKRMSAIMVITSVGIIIPGLYGMNLALPGAALENMFWYLVGGGSALMGSMALLFRKIKWL